MIDQKIDQKSLDALRAIRGALRCLGWRLIIVPPCAHHLFDDPVTADGRTRTIFVEGPYEKSGVKRTISLAKHELAHAAVASWFEKAKRFPTDWWPHPFANEDTLEAVTDLVTPFIDYFLGLDNRPSVHRLTSILEDLVGNDLTTEREDTPPEIESVLKVARRLRAAERARVRREFLRR